MSNEKIKPIKRPWHDCGSFFISNIEPQKNEPIRLLLRTEKGNVTRCFAEISHNGKDFESFEMHFSHNDTTGKFDYYAVEIPGQNEMFKYRFRLENGESTLYYSRTHFGKKAPTFDETKLQADDLWCIIPGYHTPDCHKECVDIKFLIMQGIPCRNQLFLIKFFREKGYILRRIDFGSSFESQNCQPQTRKNNDGKP